MIFSSLAFFALLSGSASPPGEDDMAGPALASSIAAKPALEEAEPATPAETEGRASVSPADPTGQTTQWAFHSDLSLGPEFDTNARRLAVDAQSPDETIHVAPGDGLLRMRSSLRFTFRKPRLAAALSAAGAHAASIHVSLALNGRSPTL